MGSVSMESAGKEGLILECCFEVSQWEGNHSGPRLKD